MLAGVLETLTNRDLHVAEQGQTFVQVFGATHFASLLRGTKFGALVFQDSRSLCPRHNVLFLLLAVVFYCSRFQALLDL